tara:strand:- start:8720 stop:10945 length:2226 start_codon:yes stop_codon:yes gene_type:complete
MANQYSNYTLAPYVSQYVNPYSVESNQILRERFDKNKANKDKVDATLGAWNTLEGDAHLVDKAKEQTKNKLNQFIENGNYEDANMAISEVMVDLESDKGLKLAKQSHDIRQQELSWMSEMQVKHGASFLDFGRDKIKSHQSYYKNEEGEFVENVYNPTNEKEHDYDKAMSGIVGNIRADYTGISRGKADKIAEALIPTYMNSTEGDQDYRRLTIINGMSHNEAVNDIRQRLQSLTDQQIHRTKAASIQNSGNKMNGNGTINKGYTAISQDNLNLADHYNKVLSSNSKVFENFETGDYSTFKKMGRDNQRIMIQQAKASMPPAEYAEWKKHNVDFYKGHEEFGALVNYSTTNTWQPTNATQEDFDTGEMIGTGGVTMAAAGAGMLVFGAANAWNPIGWGVLGALGFASLVGMGVNAVSQVAEKGYLNEKGNVRDVLNPDQGDGMLFGLLDSEAEELASNLEDTDWVNKTLGTDYKNGDPVYEQLKKNAQASLLYRQQGGGDVADDAINNYKEDIFEAETYVPDYKNTKLVNAIGEVEKQFDPSDWDFLGIPEGGDGWDEMMKTSDGKTVNPGDAKIEFRGIIAPSIDDDTPLMFKWNVNGKTYLAESKPNRPGAFDLEELIAMDMNQAQLVVLDRARQWTNQMETNRSGKGPDGNPNKQELVEHLNLLYQNIVGMDEKDAGMYAEDYMIKSFQRANPVLIEQITKQVYGEGKEYQDLTPKEREMVDNEYQSYYQIYKSGEVR